MREDIILPHDAEAEEAVLGSILINPEKFLEVSQYINGNDFFEPKNKWIWDAYNALINDGQSIDIQTVSAMLNAQGHLEKVGGKVALYSLTGKAPSSMHANSYAQIVQENSQRRRLIDASQKIMELAIDGKKKVGEIIGESEKALFDISEQHERKEIVTIQDAVSSLFDKVRELYQNGADIVGVSTGLVDLDKIIGGFQKSDLIIVAGRPGMGKTAFMLTMLRNAALREKKHVAMFSLEMSNEQLVQRLISQQTGINTQKLRTGNLSDEDLTFFVEAIDLFGETKIFLDDTPGITPMALRSKCRRLHMEHRLDLIIVDYLQLMSGDSRTESRVQEVSGISRSLKILAKELNVPVLTASQLSRGVEKRGGDSEPMLSDLRESGSLEQDADIVMFLHNPNTGNDDEPQEINPAMKLLVRKHRHGPIGDVDVIFLKNQGQFVNAQIGER